MEFPIISRLGGRDAVSELLADRVKPNAVRMWHVRKRIPGDMQLLLMAEAERRKLPYSSADFQFRPIEPRCTDRALSQDGH